MLTVSTEGHVVIQHLQCIPIITGFGTFGVPHSVPIIISHHHHLDHSYPLLSTLHLLMKVLTHLVFFCQDDIFSCCARRVKIKKLLYFWRSLKGSSSSVCANFCYSLENTAFAKRWRDFSHFSRPSQELFLLLKSFPLSIAVANLCNAKGL